MKLQKQIVKRIGGVLIFGMVLSAVSALTAAPEYTDAEEGSATEIPLAGFAAAFNAETLASLDVTAGVAVALMDTSVVAVTDTGLSTVGLGYEEVQSRDAQPQASGIRELCGYENLGIAEVDGNLNVRKSATTDSSVVGKMTNHAACEILAAEGEWYQIRSGKVEGYVSADYIITGDEAYAVAEQEIQTVATVKTGTLRVREAATTESSIVALVNENEDLIVKDALEGWYEVEVDDLSGFVSADYVEISLKLPTAQTISELRYGKGVSDVRVDLVQYALQFVGNRYVWGGTSLTNGVDCSGFTMKVYAHYGISLPHYSGSQPAYGTRIKASAARPGDLFFYGSGGTIGHVGIYIGNGQIVHASGVRTGIKVSNAFYRTPICVVSYLP